MKAFRVSRFWPLLALFALLCMAITPATAWACACQMATSAKSFGTSPVPHRVASRHAMSVMTASHSCCLNEGNIEAKAAKALELNTGKTGEHSKAHKVCCCQGDDRSVLIGSDPSVWSGWHFVAFAVLPPATFVLEAQPQTSAYYRPVAQSPPTSLPGVASRGRAPPVLAT